MFLAPSNRRAFAGLFFAMPLVAIGPLVAVAQYGTVRTMPNGSPSAMSPNNYRQSQAAPPKRESLFGDQGVSVKLPFTRTKKPTQPSTPQQRSQPRAQQPQQQPMVGRSIPKASLQDPRMGAGKPNYQQMPSRLSMPNRQGVPNKFAQRPAGKPVLQTGAPPQRVAQRPKPSPMPRPMPAGNHPIGVPKVPTAHAVPAASQASPNSPAVQMLTQAHQWCASAEIENDFTRIIVTCRQAAAEQSNPEIGRYATELASWALNRRGQLKAEAGHEEEALADFDAAIQADPTRWRAAHNRAVLLAGNGEFEKAFNDFTRTIEINPQFAKAYSNRAALFVVAGSLPSAIQDYTRAVELDPELTVAHRGLGRACHLDGQLDTAVCHYDEAVRLAPNDAYAIASRADVLTDLGRYAEAAADYDRAIEVDPNSSHAHSGSAWLLATCPDDGVRNPKLALERAQAAIKLTNGEDAPSLDTLAAAQASDGDFAAAMQTIEKAVQLASAAEKESYLQRLALYQQQKPYRLESEADVVQISHHD